MEKFKNGKIRHTGCDRRSRPRTRYPERQPRHQLQHSAESGELRPPYRSYRPRRQVRHRNHLCYSARVQFASPHRAYCQDDDQPEKAADACGCEQGREKAIAGELAGIIGEGRHQCFTALIEEMSASTRLPRLRLLPCLRRMRASCQRNGTPGRYGRSSRQCASLHDHRAQRQYPYPRYRSVHCREANVPSSKIGNIKVFDKFTFVEVPSEIADRVIGSLNEIMVKGKRVRVREGEREVSMQAAYRAY